MTLKLAIANIVFALIMIGISIPLVQEKIPRNSSYGMRISKAFESKDNWYRINKYGGKALIGWSVPVLIIGIALVFLHFKVPLDETKKGLVLLFSLMPTIVIGSLIQLLWWTDKTFPLTQEPNKAQ